MRSFKEKKRNFVLKMTQMSWRDKICHRDQSIVELRGMHKKIPHSE